jgi:hypothetical protein
LSIAAFSLSAIALVFAAIAAAAAVRSSVAAQRSAEAAESSDRQSRQPCLVLALDNPAPAPIDRVIYLVRNDGPQDLESLVIYRPRPPDGTTYPIAITGSGGFAPDEIELGPVLLTQQVRFTLCCGPADDPPEFRVRIECRSGTDLWEMSQLLPLARGTARPIPGAEVRNAVDTIRGLFQDVIVSDGKSAPYFLDETRRSAGSRVRDVADRIDDPNLKEGLNQVAKYWADAFASAPPEQVQPHFGLGDSRDEYNQEAEELRLRRTKVAEVATKGLTATQDALDRLNDLERQAAT